MDAFKAITEPKTDYHADCGAVWALGDTLAQNGSAAFGRLLTLPTKDEAEAVAEIRQKLEEAWEIYLRVWSEGAEE